MNISEIWFILLMYFPIKSMLPFSDVVGFVFGAVNGDVEWAVFLHPIRYDVVVKTVETGDDILCAVFGGKFSEFGFKSFQLTSHVFRLKER